jgi:uncharacterized protein YbaA (DUF1428 family)
MMSYIDGFVIACPEANKQKFIDHAATIDPIFLEMGALRVVECWGDDVKRGQHTDFFMAVKAEPGEAVQFSWIEWPDKATHDACFATMTEWMKEPSKADPRMDPAKNPMPFDGKRMIFGGFKTILDTGSSTAAGFIDGFVIAVPKANEAAYRKQAEGGAPIFWTLAQPVSSNAGATMCRMAPSPTFTARCRQKTTRLSSSAGWNIPTKPLATRRAQR